MAGNVADFTDINFDSDVLNSEVPVLVDFTAVWCGPCKAIAPTIAKLADEYQGRVKVGKLDIDHNPQTPTKYHVRGVPTLILFQGGQVKDQVMGAVNKKKIESMFNQVL
ncbi:MAG: thioredoxin [Deltaproteobacteria bacterium]|nr:thioredoxin [Deltaproteobacteria bacterium]